MLEYLASFGNTLAAKSISSSIIIAILMCILAAYTIWSEEKSAPVEKSKTRPTKKTVIWMFYIASIFASIFILSAESANAIKENRTNLISSYITIASSTVLSGIIFYVHYKFHNKKNKKNNEAVNKQTKYTKIIFFSRFLFQFIVIFFAMFSALYLVVTTIRLIFLGH